MPNRLYETPGTDPALNLAVEEALLLSQSPEPALFLWQNAHTVVIGRGQNAWKECRTALLSEEGGTLVRRTTGGGAVYHDLGNLNFSFVMPQGLYDVTRQLDVIRRAVARFGIETAASGRNDIVLSSSGAKFSGNAFRHLPLSSLHHGTILMDVDVSLLGRYLAPPATKLQAKGVESVRSRVGNLKEHAPGMTIPLLKEALFEAFAEEYGPARPFAWEEALPARQVDELSRKYRDWEWTYGKTPRFDALLENRFPWGGVEINLSLKNGRVTSAVCFTDANDAELAARLGRALECRAFTPGELGAGLSDSAFPEDRDVAAWLSGLQL